LERRRQRTVKRTSRYFTRGSTLSHDFLTYPKENKAIRDSRSISYVISKEDIVDADMKSGHHIVHDEFLWPCMPSETVNTFVTFFDNAMPKDNSVIGRHIFLFIV
jgi:hypothetical protein